MEGRSNKCRRLAADKRDNYPNGHTETWVAVTEREKSRIFTPVSIILSTQDKLLLEKNNGYEIRFSTGMLKGNGISVNREGNLITFRESGSYRFDIAGEAMFLSEIASSVSLIYDNPDFLEDIKIFNTVLVPKSPEGMLYLRGIPTILPISRGQILTVKIIPKPDTSIALLEGARLLIHKVA